VTREQGDQIGRFFDPWAIAYFWAAFYYISIPKFWAIFTTVKVSMYVLFRAKTAWVALGAIFSQTRLVTLGSML
jgi:hypothetical protein